MTQQNPKSWQDYTAFINHEQVNDPLSVINKYFNEFSLYTARARLSDFLNLAMESQTLSGSPLLEIANLLYYTRETMKLMDAVQRLREMIGENKIAL